MPGDAASAFRQRSSWPKETAVVAAENEDRSRSVLDQRAIAGKIAAQGRDAAIAADRKSNGRRTRVLQREVAAEALQPAERGGSKLI